MVLLGNADAVLDELPSLAQEADFVIADGPGSQTETSRALLMWAVVIQDVGQTNRENFIIRGSNGVNGRDEAC